MPRCAALVPCALAALAVRATPVPPPRPWVTGGNKPVDPDGDCRFDRDGDKLTISIPGKDQTLYDSELNAPRLLRDVAGDFVVEVRVSGMFEPTAWSKDSLAFKEGGILLPAGKET